MDRLQAEVGLVEVLAHLTGKDQRTIEIIGPLVIGTDELGGGAFVLGANAVAAVAAGVVESADDLILAAHDHDRIIADLNGEVVAGARDLAVVAHEQPVAIPDRLHVELEVILIDVKGCSRLKPSRRFFNWRNAVVCRSMSSSLSYIGG